MGYLRRFFAGFLGLLGIVAAFNALMDPYDLLGTPIIAGLNQIKSAAPERFFKPLQVSRRQPRTVLMGDSRVMMGLDPDDVPGGDAYNLGIPAETIGEEIALARHVFADTPAERIVMGLSYTSFDARRTVFPSFRLAILGRFAFWRGLPDILLSERALVRSRNAFLLSRRNGKPYNLPDGLRLIPDKPTDSSTPTDRILSDVEEYARLYRAGVTGVDGTLAAFDTLLGTLPGGVAVSAFIAPAHAALLETLEREGRLSAYDAWLARVAAICAAHGVDLWDFGDYNRITTEAMAASGDDYYDGSHFRPPVGRLILETMLGGVRVPGFGVRLTPATLAAHLDAQRAARQAWQEREPGDVSRIAAAVRVADQAGR